MAQNKARVAHVQRAQTVGNHDGGAALHDALHGLHDQGFRLHINGARGLIQDEHGRIFEKGASEGNPLAFSAREAHAPLANTRVIPFRERRDKRMRIGHL